MSKYHNKITEVDGIKFHSKREASRYQELKLMVRSGDIKELVLQPRFPMYIDGELVCTYVADFKYKTKKLYKWQPVESKAGKIIEWVDVVEDVKGARTEVYKIKKALLRALYNIEVFET